MLAGPRLGLESGLAMTATSTRYPHGTRTCYVIDRCRCQPCRDANRIAGRERIERKARERWNPDISKFVDAEPVRTHVRALMASGMGWKRVAEAAGIGSSTLYPILYGKYIDQPNHPEHRPPRKQILRRNADALLAVQPDMAAGTLVDGNGTRLRLRALVAIGWSQSQLAAMLGMTVTNFGHVINGRGVRVRRSTFEAVTALYEDLWDTPPTASRPGEARGITVAIRRAERLGWQLPMGLDDDRLDVPGYRPRRPKVAA